MRAMFQHDSESDEIQEAAVVLYPDHALLEGDVIRGREGLILKVDPKKILARPELTAQLVAGEEPVTIWAQLTDKVSGRLLQEGQELSVRLRVKLSDGRFMVKTAAFSLGVIAAVAIGSQTIRHHHKPR